MQWQPRVGHGERAVETTQDRHHQVDCEQPLHSSRGVTIARYRHLLECNLSGLIAGALSEAAEGTLLPLTAWT